VSAESKIATNFRAFKIALNSHDRENPTHSPAFGIAVSQHDLERLGFDEGEELWPGIRIFTDRGVSGNFRVLCDGEHDGEKAEAHAADSKVTKAVGVEA
jgi:hypothetical protein